MLLPQLLQERPRTFVGCRIRRVGSGNQGTPRQPISLSTLPTNRVAFDLCITSSFQRFQESDRYHPFQWTRSARPLLLRTALRDLCVHKTSSSGSLYPIGTSASGIMEPSIGMFRICLTFSSSSTPRNDAANSCSNAESIRANDANPASISHQGSLAFSSALPYFSSNLFLFPHGTTMIGAVEIKSDLARPSDMYSL